MWLVAPQRAGTFRILTFTVVNAESLRPRFMQSPMREQRANRVRRRYAGCGCGGGYGATLARSVVRRPTFLVRSSPSSSTDRDTINFTLPLDEIAPRACFSNSLSLFPSERVESPSVRQDPHVSSRLVSRVEQYGMTAKEQAQKQGHSDCVKIFEKYGY